MKVDDALPTFLAEAGELLREMEDGLLECSREAPGPETINLIFRAAHTIKGSSGLFGLDNIVSFVHGVETALDRVRLGKLRMEAALIDLLLACSDHIGQLVASVSAEPAALEALASRGAQLLAALKEIAGDFSSTQVATASSADAAVPTALAGQNWHLSLRFNRDILALGFDPLSFIRYLSMFAAITAVELVETDLLPDEEFEPQRCYIGFELDLCTTADRARIEAAFEFIREDCTLVLAKIANDSPAVEPPSTAASKSTASSAPAVTGTNTAAAAASASRTVRVDADKLDFLITRVGELITAAARANLVARRTRNSDLEESTAAVATLVEEVRESALQLRMVKIGGTFARFQRVVHDAARETGKEIELVVSGEDTELDKTVVERITDPLTHLVRNAIDHGIETAQARLARGKPAAGTIQLNAYHDSGSIVIAVTDDGGGLNREKIQAKAIERGLLEPGRNLSESELFGLIFEPGFSTAERVTNLSGRGVGMDVVKRNITALRGSVAIKSSAALGTTVTVRLPLTLAIINGFQIAVGETIFVLPLDAIDECLEHSDQGGHDFTDLRGQV
ncbi:MAG TPA: chemotaxis protein CheA, partial [Steroidobacteraceae bacterium]